MNLNEDMVHFKFKKIEKDFISTMLKNFYYRISEYYGNYAEYSGQYCTFLDIYNFLLEQEIIDQPKKHAILIGGLPCSGKTTLAKELYPNHFLIDDPLDISNIEKTLQKHNHVVVTDPHFSFKESRAIARDILEKKDFFVEDIILKVSKNILRSRAKADNKEDRLEFIKLFNVE